MGFNEFLSSVFGNKSTRDMKEIKPWETAKKSSYKSIRQKKKFWKNMKKHWTKYCLLLFLS